MVWYELDKNGCAGKNLLQSMPAIEDEEQMLEALVKHHAAHAGKESALYNECLIWLYKAKEI